MNGTLIPRKSWTVAVLAIASLSAAGGAASGAEPAQAGKDVYAVCMNCHGHQGEGIPLYAAPAIAGMPQWYLEGQLRKFRAGIRGGHPDDTEGLRMRPMSWQLRSEAELIAVAAYVAKLPKIAPKASPAVIGADAKAGATSYATCGACHGANGAGNEALKAPPIAGQNDWYLLSQLRKFKSGVRGSKPEDITGQQMRPMAQTLADEQAMKNVVAYISTLSQP